MKVSNLMIGDYLMSGGLPYRVMQVFGIVDDWWMLENGEEMAGEPIPITPKILEKNGFKYGDGYGYSFVNRKELSGDGFEEEKVYINTALNTLIIYTAASSIHLPVKYIHELQHALKLCKIEKEIVL